MKSLSASFRELAVVNHQLLDPSRLDEWQRATSEPGRLPAVRAERSRGIRRGLINLEIRAQSRASSHSDDVAVLGRVVPAGECRRIDRCHAAPDTSIMVWTVAFSDDPKTRAVALISSVALPALIPSVIASARAVSPANVMATMPVAACAASKERLRGARAARLARGTPAVTPVRIRPIEALATAQLPPDAQAGIEVVVVGVAVANDVVGAADFIHAGIECWSFSERR